MKDGRKKREVHKWNGKESYKMDIYEVEEIMPCDKVCERLEKKIKTGKVGNFC